MPLILENLWQAFKVFGRAFIIEPSIWWVLAPIFVLWIALQIYFGAHEREALGWNTALANGISLSWVCIEAFRALFVSRLDDLALRFIFVGIIFIYGIIVLAAAFIHVLPKGQIRRICGPTTVYFLAMLATLWGHNLLPIQGWLLLDLLLLYIVLRLFFLLVRKFIPESEPAQSLTEAVAEAKNNKPLLG